MAYIPEQEAAKIAGLTPRGLRRKVLSGEYEVKYRVRLTKEGNPRAYQYRESDLDKLFIYSDNEKDLEKQFKTA